MRIQHNISAMNSYRQLGNNNNMLSKNLEKLSSGYRINRAGDDAAGLAISEKMRAQIKGLETASKNANDAISLVQTAEGALTEVHSMLNRMTELATQSANGTYDNKVDRENLQKEVVALLDEIDRISESTNFNGINLLDGSLGVQDVSFGVGQDAAEETTDITSVFTGAMASVQEGTIAEGNEAKAAVGSFYMPNQLQATVDTANTNATQSFTLTVGDGAGGTAGTITVNLHTGNTSAAGTKTTAEMSDIVDLIKNGTGAGALGTGSTTAAGVEITLTANGGAVDSWEDFNNMYDISFKNNKLTVTAKNEGSKYSVAGAFTGIANGTNTKDKTAMEESLKNNLAGGGAANIAVGADTMQSQAGKDGTASNYTVASGVMTMAAKEDLHDTAVTIGGKTYVMKANGEELSEVQKKLVADGAELVKFDATAAYAANDAQTGQGALIAAINKFAGETGIQAKGGTGDITLSETEAYGKKVLAGDVESIDMEAAVEQASTVKAADKGNHQITLGDDMEAGTQITVGDKTYEFVADGATKLNDKAIAVAFTEGDGDANAAALQAEIAKDANFANATVSDGTIDLGVDRDTDVKLAGAGKGRAMQVGDTADDFNKVFVKVNAMDSKSLGIDEINISTQEGASVAIEKIKAAINTVSSTRGDLGAVQNRLEHTINNLGVTTENITAAESRIRDTDMASEMMAYTKNNILIQASQAMLAQANQVPQGVLQLLQ